MATTSVSMWAIRHPEPREAATASSLQQESHSMKGAIKRAETRTRLIHVVLGAYGHVTMVAVWTASLHDCHP